jgi:prepilin-type N-terminal cleavage/methylation domain-containing protein
MRRCCTDAESAAGRRRGGFTLVELVVALALTGLLGGIVFSTLVAQLRLARVTASTAVENDAARTAATVVAGEVRRAAASDLRAIAADSLAIRTFRGLAIPCADDGTAIVVRYRGDRLPDVRKDSLLALNGAAARALALVDSRAAAAVPCTALAGEALLRWVIERPDSLEGELVAMLVFESGRYFLAGRALRYRVGAEGRQPLTAEVFGHPATRFDTQPVGAVHYTLSIGQRGPLLLAAPFAPWSR